MQAIGLKGYDFSTPGRKKINYVAVKDRTFDHSEPQVAGMFKKHGKKMNRLLKHFRLHVDVAQNVQYLASQNIPQCIINASGDAVINSPLSAKCPARSGNLAVFENTICGFARKNPETGEVFPPNQHMESPVDSDKDEIVATIERQLHFQDTVRLLD